MLKHKIEGFLSYCRIAEFSEKSIETLSTRLAEFNRFCSDVGLGSPRDIAYEHVRDFAAKYRNPSIHVKKARIWTLRQLFHFLKLNGWVDKNIASDLPYPKIEKVVPLFLTQDEYHRILSYFYQRATDLTGLRNLAIVMILGLLGLRLATIISLDIEDVDLEAGLMWVCEKGQKHRMLTIPGVLCTILSQYCALTDSHQGPLFVSRNNKRISPRTLEDIFQQVQDALGIEKHLHAHLFRHTAATHLNRVSTPEITQQVLGHNRRKSTEKYTHLNPDQYAVYMRQHPYMKGATR